MFINPGANLFGQVEIAGSSTHPPPMLTDLSVSAQMADGSTGSGLTRSQVLESGSSSAS